MSGGYNPKVSNPNSILPQMTSECFKKPFYTGGSQVPVNLLLSKSSYLGAGFVGDRPPKYNDGKYHILKQGKGTVPIIRNRRNRNIRIVPRSNYTVSIDDDENDRTPRGRASTAIYEQNELEEVIIQNGMINNPLSILNNNPLINIINFSGLGQDIYDKMDLNIPITIDEYNVIKNILRRYGIRLPNYN